VYLTERNSPKSLFHTKNTNKCTSIGKHVIIIIIIIELGYYMKTHMIHCNSEFRAYALIRQI